MKKVLKLVVMSIILIMVILWGNQVLAEAKMQVEARLSKSIINVGDEVAISLSIKQLDELGIGVNAYVLTLNFSTEQFDFVRAEGKNNWNPPVYNEKLSSIGKVKFVATKSNFTTEKNEILKITLKAKQNFKSNIPNISITDMSFAAKINDKTTKIQMSDFKLQLMGNGLGGQGYNGGQSSEIKTSKTTTTNSSLPHAGKQILGAFIILIVAISILIFYFKYRRLDKYVK